MLPSRLDLQRGSLIRRKSEPTAWLSRARRGNLIVYHHGFLVIDRGSTSPLGERERRRLDALATAVRAAATAGLVHLVQERLAPGTFGYLAIKADQNLGLSMPALRLALRP